MKNKLIFISILFLSQSVLAGGDTWSRQSTRTAQSPLVTDINGTGHSITNVDSFVGSNFTTRAGVTLNAPPSFSVVSGVAQPITNSIVTKIKFPSPAFDVGSGWDNVNNVYIPPKAGKYEFYTLCRLEDLADGAYMYLSIYLDGEKTRSTLNYSPFNGDITSQLKVVLPSLTTTNQISVYVNQGDSRVRTLKASYSWFSGRYIGE